MRRAGVLLAAALLSSCAGAPRAIEVTISAAPPVAAGWSRSAALQFSDDPTRYDFQSRRARGQTVEILVRPSAGPLAQSDVDFQQHLANALRAAARYMRRSYCGEADVLFGAEGLWPSYDAARRGWRIFAACDGLRT